VLEFGQPRARAIGRFYNVYTRHILPRLGGAVTGDRAAYEYLQKSAGRFPCREEFVSLMRESAELASVEFAALTFGVAYLYRAVKG
jgi:demethylmenaquinone methyltransferase / 2-methoxy-6-polyprenyl-1,4-benzoquinol methylase